MRLIDKDLLEEAVQGAINIMQDNGCDMTSASIPLAIIKGAPIVVDGTRVHSHWKCTDAYPHWCYCANCYKKFVPNVEWIELYNIPTKYCPNCGAIMDEEVSE